MYHEKLEEYEECEKNRSSRTPQSALRRRQATPSHEQGMRQRE